MRLIGSADDAAHKLMAGSAAFGKEAEIQSVLGDCCRFGH